MNSEFVLRVLQIFSKYDSHDNLWWRTDDKYAPVTFFVNCNDLFFWAYADLEEITEQNIDCLEQSFVDASAAHEDGDIYGTMLFCCRQRKMRPQGAAYPKVQELWPLFDACGPEREIGFGNPAKPGQ